MVLAVALAGVASVAAYGAMVRFDVLEPSMRLGVTAFVALGVLSWVANEAWGGRRRSQDWAAGADGEEATAAVLAPLVAQGIVVLHDRRVPGRRSNIDHLVVGPFGVVVVDSKRWSKGAEIRGDRLLSAGRDRSSAVEGARRQRKVVADVVGPGVPVRAVLCIHGGRVEQGGFRPTFTIDGVRVCSGRQLVELVRRGDRTLGPDAVSEVAARLDATFTPMTTG